MKKSLKLLVLILSFIFSCTNKETNEKIVVEPNCNELFDHFVTLSSRSLSHNSVIGCVNIIDSVKAKDSLVRFEETINYVVKFASYSWKVVLNDGDSAVLTINYWNSVSEMLISFLEFHNHNEDLQLKYTSLFKVGNFFCNARLNKYNDEKFMYFLLLQNSLLTDYIKLLHDIPPFRDNCN